MHSTMSPPASNSGLRPFDPAQDEPATCKTAAPPPHAYLQSRRYPTRRLKNVYFEYCARSGRAREWPHLTLPPDLHSVFHNQPWGLRCGCAVSIRSSKGPEIRFWHLVTMACAHVHGFCESPYQPHGRGCTQSDMFFVLFQRWKNDFKGFPRKSLLSTVHTEQTVFTAKTHLESKCIICQRLLDA